VLTKITEYVGGVRAYLPTRAGLSPSRAVGRLGRAVACCRARAGWRAGPSRALVGRCKKIRFSYFPKNRNVYLFSVMNPTSINRSKLPGCPKIVKLSLLSSQKYHLSVSVVSSQLAVMIIGS